MKSPIRPPADLGATTVGPKVNQRALTPLARISLGILTSWVALALAAPLIQPTAEEAEILSATDPTTLSFLPPLTIGAVFSNKAADGTPQFTVRDPNQAHPGEPLLRKRFWLGTDRIGEDLLLKIAQGAGTSLLVGLIAALLAVTIGIGVGAVAGLSTALVDNILMRVVDAMLAFPLLLLVLLLDLLFDPGLASLILILGAAQWMSIARIVRGEMLRLRNAPFVLAARAIGATGFSLFSRHLLPNASRPIMISGLLLVGDSILLESAVSFLGFGTASDLSSWGRLVDSGRAFLVDAWWISTFPGLAIVLVVTAINLLGDATSDHAR